MRYEHVKVTRDERTVYNRPVLPWEVAILEFTFGDGSVEHTGKFVDNNAAYPEPKEEFLRLQGTYGSDPESGIPYAASVYGQASAGVRHLAALIDEAEEEARTPLPKQTQLQRAKEYQRDPLMG